MSNAHQQRAWAALQHQQFDLARREATAALAADPDNKTARLILGEASMRTGDCAAGREQATELLRVAPDWGWSHWLLAWSLLLDHKNEVFQLQTISRLRRAFYHAHQALACDPNETAFFELAVRVAMEAGDNHKAMQLIDRGLALNPNSQFLQRFKGQVYNAVRDPTRASEAFRGSLALAPEDHVTHRELARTLFTSGQFRAAREHIQEALRLDPNDALARQMMLTINQTQHWLLRSAMWFHQSTRLIRLWFPLWAFVTVLAGLPLVVGVEYSGLPRWLALFVYFLWMLVVWLPLETLVLPLVTDMLWVLIGRDAVQRCLTWQERWDRLVPGIIALTAPLIVLATVALYSIALPSIYVAIIVLALLQSAAAARPGLLRKFAFAVCGAFYLWLAYTMLNLALPYRPGDIPNTRAVLINFHVFTLLLAFIFRVAAARRH